MTQPIENAEKYAGLLIVGARLVDNELRLDFDAGRAIGVWDAGQSCCERRYITTDDEVSSLIGGRLISIVTKPAPWPPSYDEEDEDVYETMFVDILTDKGFITLTTHNEHNGYYGGFDVVVREQHGESDDLSCESDDLC